MKDSLIDFLNYTTQRIKIAPINSSKGRWEGFTLSPGEKRTIRDSNGGSNNYDIEYSVQVNRIGKKNDPLIGSFQADNHWLAGGNPSIKSLSDSVMAGVPANPAWGGKKISMRYYEWLFASDARKNREVVFGAVDYSKFEVSYEENLARTPKYWSVDVNGAFVPDIPIARTTYLGADGGAHAWKFAIDEL